MNKFKNSLLIILLIILQNLVFAQRTPYYDSKFTQALDKVVNDYINEFENLKGKPDTSNIYQSQWFSKLNLPGCQPATIDNGNALHHSVWRAKIIVTKNKDEMRKKYLEFVNKINPNEISCCGFGTNQNITTNESGEYMLWSSVNVKGGKDKRFEDVGIFIQQKQLEDKSYEVEIIVKHKEDKYF